jgi:hypothetical protein
MNWMFLFGVYWLVSLPVAVLLGRLLTEYQSDKEDSHNLSRPIRRE